MCFSSPCCEVPSGFGVREPWGVRGVKPEVGGPYLTVESCQLGKDDRWCLWKSVVGSEFISGPKR
jgi:hypothetical protein